MLNKKLVASVKISNDKETLPKKFIELNLEYYVLERISKNKDNKDLKLYGVEIVKRELVNDNTILVEKKSMEDVSVSEKWIYELVAKLAKYAVTPVSLKNVLEDTVGVA